MKPNGKLFFTFPHQDMWREVHSNVFFVHWMKPQSHLRRVWLYLNRLHGQVRLKRNRPGRKWVNFFDRWLVENTHYLTLSQIRSVFDDAGLKVWFNEADYLFYRLIDNGRLNSAPRNRLLIRLAGFLSRRYAGLAGGAQHR